METQTCNRELIDRYLSGQVTDAEAEAVEEHALGCASCFRAVEEGTSQGMEVSRRALPEVLVPLEVHAKMASALRRRRLWTSIRGRGGFMAAALVAGVGAGCHLSMPTALNLLFPAAYAVPSSEFGKVAGFAGYGFEGGDYSIEGFEGEMLHSPTTFTKMVNHASIDDSESKSGGRSLRLLHRHNGGYFERRVPIPLPPNTTLRLGFWVYSPRGADPNNKLLNASIASPDGDAATLTLTDASPHWRPYLIHRHTMHYWPDVVVTFETGSGFGRYFGYDWASWIDDIYLAIRLNGAARIDWYVQDGHRIIIPISLPKPYHVSRIQSNTIHLKVGHLQKNMFPGRIVRLEGDFAVCAFESKEAADLLMNTRHDGDLPMTANVLGRVGYGEFEVGFTCGVEWEPHRQR